MTELSEAGVDQPIRLSVVMARQFFVEPPEVGFFQALERRFVVVPHTLGPGRTWSIPDSGPAAACDVCLVFLPFRWLADNPDPLDWGSFAGLRLMYDTDALQHYHGLARTRFFGTWPQHFHRHRFELLVSTGKRTTEVLESEGIPTRWIPKAYNHEIFRELDGPRSGIGHYGTLYHSRAAMLDYLKRRRIEVEHFRAPQDELNTRLNALAGCIVCNLEGIRGGGLYKFVNMWSPSRAVRVAPGVEPMIKNFEVAASGCAPIMDRIDEFEDLGFADGEEFVGWSDFDELVDVLRFYESREDELRTIGERAAKLARERHTWDHRAEALENLLRDTLSTR